MSIAQFLPPGTVDFDILVIDEASQMRPEDALGAIARCKQCVIVGDTKQLPPTGFFDKLVEGDGADDSNLSDVESILDAALLPLGGGRTLRWHYRSKHESLIAFSNKEFYESKLNIFPSPVFMCTERGMIPRYVENGVYARGGSRKNMVEAEVVAKAVINHIERCGDLSLGVVALSKAQQEAIQDKLEEQRRLHPDYEWFFSDDQNDTFFIKNLETVQGDERDVIFISIGYGKDDHGFAFMSFGPLNREGGWRRLNVLITRARYRCEVFYSIKAEDIRIDDLTDTGRQIARGRVTLRNFLAYIETGRLEQPHENFEAEADSPFEESVAVELERLGFVVRKQVGVANFRIDLAVVDPHNPGKYLIGIECDGASYHSAKSARDRDRLRQEVLEGLGWKIHRIWSLDWMRNQSSEMKKLLEVIEKSNTIISLIETTTMKSPVEIPTQIVRSQEIKTPKLPHELVEAIPYKIANVDVTTQWDTNNPPHLAIMEVIKKILMVESPIYIDELIKRVSDAWNFKRTGNRIRGAILTVIRSMERAKKIKVKNSFLWLYDMEIPTVRNRSNISFGIESVSQEEIQNAAKQIRSFCNDITNDSLVNEIAKSLGISRVSAQINTYIREALNT